MLIQGQRSATVLAPVTIPPRTMEGFSLYENTEQNLTIRYPSTWSKQEISLNNDHTALEVMFVVPSGTHFSKWEDSETIYDKIRYVIYNQSSPEVVLSLKRLLMKPHTSQDVINDHIHALRICFDNVNILETSHDYNIGKMPSSRVLYTYTDPLQSHLHKEGMKIIGINDEHKEISITYSSQTEDFGRFLPTIRRMIDTLTIEGLS